MEINLKSTKRYIRSAIKETSDVTIDLYTEKFDSIYGWRIGILDKEGILTEIDNIVNGTGIQSRDEFTIRKIGHLYEVYKEFLNINTEVDWKLIREKFEENQKNEWESLPGRIEFDPDFFLNQDNPENTNLESIYDDEYEQNDNLFDYDLIKRDINEAVVSLNLSGHSIIDIRKNINNDSNMTLTFINTSLNSEQLNLLSNKINDILKSLTENSVKTEINRIQDRSFIQSSFIL